MRNTLTTLVVNRRRREEGPGHFVVLCLAVVMALAATDTMIAQRVVNVAPGFGTLNVAVFGDTLATGERVDTNTVYVLERNGIYILDGAMDHSFPLAMVAAPGAGELPRLILGVPSGGSAPAEPLVPRANLFIRNLYVTCRDELGGQSLRIVRLRTPEIRVIVDSCWLNDAGQSAFRVDASGTKIYLTNTVISNIGTMESPDNGRGIDDRGNDIDTIVSVNCTYYNLTSRVLRDGGGVINYAKYDHNTMVNTGQRLVSFGQVTEAIYTNNIAINPGFLGDKSLAEDPASVDVDVPPAGPQTVHIAYNNFYTDSLLVQALPDTVHPNADFDSTAQSFIDAAGTGSTMISEWVVFTNGPDSPVASLSDWYADPAPPNPGMDTVGQPFNFSYMRDQESYIAGYQGQPLGDLNWLNVDLVGVEPAADIPSGFRLVGNYPNPFNPETVIRFELAQASDVTLTVYTLLGERVAMLADRRFGAGTYDLHWDGTGGNGLRAASGLYIARMEADGSVATAKMMLVK